MFKGLHFYLFIITRILWTSYYESILTWADSYKPTQQVTLSMVRKKASGLLQICPLYCQLYVRTCIRSWRQERLSKSEVQMVRCWRRKHFFFCYMLNWTGTQSLSKRQNMGQYLAFLTKQAWSIKVLSCSTQNTFSCRKLPVILHVWE